MCNFKVTPPNTTMESKDVSLVAHRLKTVRLKENLLKECRVMAAFALSNGKSVDASQIAPLHKEDDQINGKELLPVYNYLANLVKPATPGTLVLFEKNRQSTNPLKFLGPLPIVREFMLLSMFSLLALILTSLSADVNTHTIQLSLLQGDGTDQALRLAFLLSCASVGGSFYALFKMNSYINQGTFDMKYSATYWSRFVLGLVAGVLLSELFVVFINPEESTKQIMAKEGLNESAMVNSINYLLKPILAILGGFSANLVYRILNRLIEAVESIFKGSATETVNNMQQKFAMESQEAEHRIKSATAHHIMTLKSDLVSQGVGKEVLDKVDTVLGDLIDVAPGTNDIVDTETLSAVDKSKQDVSETTELELPQTGNLSPSGEEVPLPVAKEENAPSQPPEDKTNESKETTTSNW